MAVSAEFRAYVLDQLRRVVPVTARPMFGGVGIYSRGTFFALLYDEAVWFKADETTYPAYAERRSRAFDPFARGKKPGTRGYYELPEDVLDDEEELRAWSRDAIAAAKRVKKK